MLMQQLAFAEPMEGVETAQTAKGERWRMICMMSLWMMELGEGEGQLQDVMYVSGSTLRS